MPEKHAAATNPGRPAGAETADDLASHASDRDFVMSFARGMSVIHAFAHARRPLSIADISHRTRLSRGAVRRLLHTLSVLGYVQPVGSAYALAPRTLELGHAFTSSNDLAQGTQRIVNRISETLRVFCAMTVLEGDETMLVCMAGLRSSATPAASQLLLAIGGKAPLYASATGLVFLSEFSDAALDDYLARVALRPYTVRTPTAPEHLRATLREVRAQRYALIDRTIHNEQRSIAVPVIGASGGMAAALVAMVTVGSPLDGDLRSTVLPMLSAAAREAGALGR